MIDNEILRVALHYTLKGASDVMNVFHFQYQGTGDTDASVLTDIDGWLTLAWGGPWAAMTSNDATMTYADVDVVTVLGTVTRNIGVALTPKTGSLPQDESSVATAFFMMADTGFPKSRGKKYIPDITEEQIDDGFVDAVALAQLVTILSVWMTPVTAPANGTLVPGVLSLTRAAFLAFTGSGFATDVPAYQRRRKPNVGA